MGNTCYYIATEDLLPYIEENKVITTFVNGTNNFGKTNPENIIKQAKDKNIRINMIVYDLSPEFAADLIRITEETNGIYYAFKKLYGN